MLCSPTVLESTRTAAVVWMSNIGLTINSTFGGARFYAENLARGLIAEDRPNRYTLLTDQPSNYRQWEVDFGCGTERVPFYSKYQSVLWDHLQVPLGVRRKKLDLLHHTKCACPVFSTVPTVVTIHDLAFFALPDMFARTQGLYMRANYRYAARKAARIITDSESSRRDLIQGLGVEERKVSAIYLGSPHGMKRVDDSDRLAHTRRRYELPKRYILYLGTIHPAKNLRMLVTAYQRLKRTTGVPHDLVIAGRTGWLTRDIIETARETTESAPVVFPGIVHEADKAALYSGADLFVSPSLYEGFGLTILEAMQCGTPVVSSNVTSIPEVTGDAAVLVDPRSEEELVHAMERVLGDEALRRRLSERGLAQCRKFSWEKTARETAAVYEQVLGGG